MIRDIENDSNEVYKINIGNILIDSCPHYEFVKKTSIDHKGFYDYNNILHFPINSKDYLISPIFNEIEESLKGFKLFIDFKYNSEILFPKKESWEYLNLYEFSNMSTVLKKQMMKLGKHDDINAWVSYRLKEEITDWSIDPRIHPEAKEARDASGIYRIDTNGQNAFQLVRSWPYNPGGLQISGDGETIYYAYILPDSTSAIMKMDRFGKNKEIVFKLDPEVLSVESQYLKPKIYPNPASESITISGIELGKVEIFNSLGQKLIEKEIISTSQIDISNIQTGLCILKIESGGKIMFEKVVVSR